MSKAPVNAICFDDWLAVPAMLGAIARDEEIRALVVIGEGKHFSAGNDRREFGVGGRADLDRGTAAVRDGLKAFATCPIITVAAVDGAAMGSALGLACMADVRIGTAGALLGLPEVKAGAFGGYRFVRDYLPDGEVRRMQLTGEPMKGERAYQLGFFQELVEKEHLLPRAIALAGELTQHLRPEFARKVKRVFVGRANEEMWRDYELERLWGVDYLEAGL
ncbi:MAG: enoyl-CoA hydratase/isomerase family protein [Rhizobium sp.]|nr:enoyl-CoA hydratase/isomerase family protein [Rhizobium sp.]